MLIYFWRSASISYIWWFSLLFSMNYIELWEFIYNPSFIFSLLNHLQGYFYCCYFGCMDWSFREGPFSSNTYKNYYKSYLYSLTHLCKLLCNFGDWFCYRKCCFSPTLLGACFSLLQQVMLFSSHDGCHVMMFFSTSSCSSIYLCSRILKCYAYNIFVNFSKKLNT